MTKRREPTQMFSALVLCAVFVSVQFASAEDVSPSAVEKDNANVTIVVRSRKSVWKPGQPLYFDVVVKNGAAESIKLPYIYDSLLEIDGQLYTQFPKPKLSGEPRHVIPADSKTGHGAVTLNGAFTTVDAKTGKRPLELAVGEHTLVLICDSHRSAAITFRIVE